MKRAMDVAEAAALIPEGATLMIGGFMGVGSPHRLIDALVARGTRGLTVIANDTAKPGVGIGRLIDSGQVRRVIASHIGLNPVTQRKMFDREIEVDLVPQGTLVEGIRAAGYGLGGVLVQTGLGTVAADGKRTIEVAGRAWLLAEPVQADFALIHANQADYAGNLAYQLTATNFNPVMAMAASIVICEAREILPIGMITPDQVTTPGVLVDHLVSVARAA